MKILLMMNVAFLTLSPCWMSGVLHLPRQSDWEAFPADVYVACIEYETV